MKEFIDKLIGRLEEQQTEAENEMHRLRSGDYTLPCSYDITDIKEIVSESFKESIEIVNELAEEFGKDTNVTTNADRIRSMNDEELAEFLYDTNHYFENNEYLVRFGSEIVQDEEINILDWLQSEVEGVTENEQIS